MTSIREPDTEDRLPDPAGHSDHPRGGASAGGGDALSTSIVRGIAWSHAAGDSQLSSVDAVTEALRDPDTRVWVDLEDASQADLDGLGASLGIHPLVIEDILERNQRAKVEYTDDLMHLVVVALVYGDTLKPVELDIVLGKRFLLTSTHPPGSR